MTHAIPHSALVHVMVVGTSEPQDFALIDDGVALDGTGATPSIEWRDDATYPAPEVPPTTVAWISAAAGTVRVSGTEGMVRGTYFFRFKLIDGASKVSFVPNKEKAPYQWLVVRV